MLRHSFFFGLISLLVGWQTTFADESRRLAELDAYWLAAARTVREGDFVGYKATYHEDAILVSHAKKESYPISKALAGWKQGFLDTKAKKIKANVEFRFTQRFGDDTTAHETGIFHYSTVDVDGTSTSDYIHFEGLLIKKNGWKLMMEYQKSPASLEEWEAASSRCDCMPLAEPRLRSKPRVVFNDDAQMLSEAPQEGTSDFVKAWLDKEAAAVPFSTYVFLAATPDICTFKTKAGETYGDRFGSDYSKGWAAGIRGLHAEGTDALHVVTEHMQNKGKEVLAAIRMNDTHHRRLDRDEPLCPLFAIENPQFVIVQPDGRTNETALDYSHAMVRDHRMEIMREIVEEYDVDGLELNFVRWAKHFPRDKGRENAAIMTNYVGQIRKMMSVAATHRGCDRLTLGVRVPESIAACWLASVDIETWVRRGWIDYVVVSTWNNTDPQLPIDQFTRFTKPAGVDTIVVMGNMIGSLSIGPPSVLDRPNAMSAKHKTNNYLAMLITESEARGAAANYFVWGADSISYWNVGIHFGNEETATAEQQARMTRWTLAVRSKESVFAGPRTYRYLPMGKGISRRKPPARNYPWYDEGRSPLGHINSPVLTLDELKKRRVFKFRMADGRNGEKLAGRMTFWVYHLTDKDELSLDINGRQVDPSVVKRFPAGTRRGGLRGQRFEISLVDCPAFRGDNELGLTLKTIENKKPIPYMEELEVVVNN